MPIESIAPIAYLLVALVALVLGLQLWRAWRDRSGPDAGEVLSRVVMRLGEERQHAEQRTRELEDQIRGLDQSLRSLHGELQRNLERRLGELQTESARASGDLRTALAGGLESSKKDIGDNLADARTQTVRSLGELREQLQGTLGKHRTTFEQRQGEALKALQDSLQTGIQVVQAQVTGALTRTSEDLGKRVESLTRSTDERLRDISGQVDKRLSEGFEKTTATFADVLKRLALIDEAQKKITELSSNVVSLQEVLSDKRSRGAFGEVQLNALVRNVMPESTFSLQHTLSNERVADCVLFLPHPTGNVAIDAKFPLEAYHRLTDIALPEVERRQAERQFKQDIRKHIQDISEKYIIPGETSDGAIMFIPAEAVFAEIQAHHGDLVHASQRARVWMVSPTTLMAILNTSRAVLKDEATRQQVHIIQQHLAELARDFDRFQRRMDNLAKHVRLANRDVEEVNVSAQKISNRFEKIESVELEPEHDPAVRIERDEESTVGSDGDV